MTQWVFKCRSASVVDKSDSIIRQWWNHTDEEKRIETRPSATLVPLILRGLAWHRTRADFDGSDTKNDVVKYAV